jgi:energy-coupling factor transporter transmembrane protein EcfT
MKIEIKGILFFIVFAGLSLFLNSVVLASINLLAILFVNFDIFFNKKLYKNFLSEEAIKNL